MCGIAGFCDPRRKLRETELEQIAYRMSAALRHRGPDDEGTWADPQAGLAMGHRRLAIQDLSEQGHQPMQSADGRYVLVFNGEIYNFRALRSELMGPRHVFRGHSDTEVILAAFCEWGIVASLQRCVGMFALAVWDRQSRSLCLARDRAGEKPLYYGWNGDVFVFGSELKAIQAHPRWNAVVDHGAVALLTRFGYIPAPFCIYQGIHKLVPGCVLTLSEAQLQGRALAAPRPYWSMQTVTAAGAARPFNGTEREAADQLDDLLRDAIGQQMVADVPLGAFLSGGIDSSLVVALMQAQSRRPVKTFSIGFHQKGFDEAHYAKAVARHLGTDHTERYVGPDELVRIISRLPGVYDEPFADASQIPTILLCELARSQVTVSLSGDAGDELFGGYEDYRKAQRIWPLLDRIPRALRSGIACPLTSLAELGLKHRFWPGAVNHLLGRVGNLAELLPVSNDRAFYQKLMSPNRAPQAWLSQEKEPATRFDDALPWESLPALLHRMMYVDFVSYLPDDILVKVDRAAMSVSLETRIPLLDHRIVEYAWSLPRKFRQRHGQGKYLLRQVLYRYVPSSLVERPKKGFNAPITEWLRGPLRSWGEDLLAGARLRQEGFFDEKTVARKWIEHLTGRRDWGYGLWHVLMFQTWLDQQRASRTRPDETSVPAPPKAAPAEEAVCRP